MSSKAVFPAVRNCVFRGMSRALFRCSELRHELVSIVFRQVPTVHTSICRNARTAKPFHKSEQVFTTAGFAWQTPVDGLIHAIEDCFLRLKRVTGRCRARQLDRTHWGSSPRGAGPGAHHFTMKTLFKCPAHPFKPVILDKQDVKI